MAHAEASAKTVEAAVTAAASQLGLRSDQVEVEILDDPVPSTFGYIGSPARVRVTPRTAPAPVAGPDRTAASVGAMAAASPESTAAGESGAATATDIAVTSSAADVATASSATDDAGTASGPSARDATAASSATDDAVLSSGTDAATEVDGSASPSDRPAGAVQDPAASPAGSVAPPFLGSGPSDAVSTAATTASSTAAAPSSEESDAASPVSGVTPPGSADARGMSPAAQATESPSTEAPPAVPTANPPASSASGTASARALEARPPRAENREAPVAPEMVEQDTERAGDFLEGLLDALDVDGDITTWVDEAGGHIDLEGADLDMLVGPNGETLDALQELTRLAVLRRSKRRVRLLLDINGFRAQQQSQLVSVVRATTEQVIATRQEHELRPMTPAERKIVHDAVAAIEGAITESLGEEPNRRVVIRPS